MEKGHGFGHIGYWTIDSLNLNRLVMPDNKDYNVFTSLNNKMEHFQVKKRKNNYIFSAPSATLLKLKTYRLLLIWLSIAGFFKLERKTMQSVLDCFLLFTLGKCTDIIELNYINTIHDRIYIFSTSITKRKAITICSRTCVHSDRSKIQIGIWNLYKCKSHQRAHYSTDQDRKY